MNELKQKSSFYSRIGIDRNRLLAVTSLSLILVTVLFVQFRGPGTAATISDTVTAVTEQASLESQTHTGASERGQSVIARKAALARETVRGLDAKPTGVKPGEDLSRLADFPNARTNPVPAEFPGKIWPEIDPAEMQLQSPFGLPTEIVELQQAKKEKEIREAQAKAANIRLLAEKQRQAQARQVMFNLKQQGVRFVFVNGSERVAQIGSRMVKVGDVIDGVRISQIHPGGSVILEVVESELDPVDLPR